MSKIYLAGPITGKTYDEARYGWRKEFMDLLDPGIEVLSPMRHEGHLAEINGPLQENYPSHLFSHAKMIVAKDFLDIDMCDIVVACFLGATTVSRGTLVELGYAKKAGKTIIVIRSPDDKAHDYPFVNEVAAAVIPDLQTAAVVVNSLLSTGV